MMMVDTEVDPDAVAPVPADFGADQWRAAGAVLRTNQIAGAIAAALALTIGYVQTRVQFGRPIGKFQAIQQNLAISVPTLSQIAAEAAFDGRAELEDIKHGYQENRRILLDGLPMAGLDSFLPVDGAFYLYADVSRFSSDSFAFASRMLKEAGVAVTPGVDFDPIHGSNFIRLCYAGSRQDLTEAVERTGAWLKG